MVGPSERISVAQLQTLQTTPTPPAPGTQLASVVDDEPVADDGTGGGGGSTPTNNGTNGTTGTTGTPCRVDKQTEYLTSMWMRDVSEYENWFLGDPEIKLQIKGPLGGNGGSSLYSALFTMSRSDIESTYFCNAQLYQWDKAINSDAAQYYWVEQDGGTIFTVTFGLEYTLVAGTKATANVSFPVGSDDDIIGDKPMNFDFCPSDWYSLGDKQTEFRWQMQNRP